MPSGGDHPETRRAGLEAEDSRIGEAEHHGRGSESEADESYRAMEGESNNPRSISSFVSDLTGSRICRLSRDLSGPHSTAFFVESRREA